MSRLQIFEPEAATNLITNPRVANNADGFTASGSAISRSLDRARFGRASIRIETNGAGLQEGAYWRINPQTQNTFYGGSVYVRGTGTIQVRLRDGTNGIEFTGPRTVLHDNGWVRLEVIGRTGGNISDDITLFVETIGSVQDVTFYADGFQIEANSHITTYCDGDLEKDLPPHNGDPYFSWTGPENDSTSSRSDRYRPGGRPRNIEFEDVGVYVTQASGLGMPPIRLNVMRFGTLERSKVQNFQAQARAINLLFWAKKDPVTRVCTPASLRELHSLRERLEELIKPDRSPDAQPFRMRYIDNGQYLDVLAHYESGLEFDGDIRFPWFNSFGVRTLIPDPFWEADSQDVANLASNQSIVSADYIIARINGEWQALGTGANGLVRTIAIAPNGDIYAGGDFTSMGGVANTERIARWDGTAWNGLGAGVDNGSVVCLEFDGAGRLYVGGNFTDVDGGTDAEAIARYDPSSDTWTGIMAGQGDGLDDMVTTITVTRSGRVYIGGLFDETDDSSLTVNKICRYDPDIDTAFAMGAGPGLDNTVNHTITDIDGEILVVGGNFEANFGGAAGELDRVITYGFDTNVFTEMSDGSDERVRHFAKSLGAKIYAAGRPTNIGFNTVQKVAFWNGQEWYPLGNDGDGLSGGADARWVAITPKGRAYFVGDFTGATGLPDNLVIPFCSWNGTTFSPEDLQLGGGVTIYAVENKGEDIYLGYDTGGVAALASTVVTVTNRGKASIGPVLEIKGPLRLLRLANLTTGHTIRMDLRILDGERLLLDLRQGRQKAVTDFRGNVMDGILPDSDVGSFRLIPGDNRIAFFALEQSGDTEISLHWDVSNWSFDDIAWAS